MKLRKGLFLFSLTAFFSLVPTYAATVCVYEAIEWEVWAGGEYLGQGVYYDLLYCYDEYGEVSVTTDPTNGGGGTGGTGDPQDPDPPTCTGNLSLTHTMTMSQLMGSSVSNPTTGRWGNGFQVTGQASGMSNGDYQMKAYLQGAGIAGNLAILDWQSGQSIQLYRLTGNLYVNGSQTSEQLRWYVGAKFTCNDGTSIEDSQEGSVAMYRKGDYLLENGSWTNPIQVGSPEPLIVVGDCQQRSFTYGNQLQYQLSTSAGFSLSSINAQLGLTTSATYSSGLQITGPSNQNYMIAKVTRRTSLPIKRVQYNWLGNQTGTANFDLDKTLYSYEVTNITNCN